MNEKIVKMKGESDYQYHKRLVYGKLVDRTLADVDYSELSECLYGQQYSSDHTRKAMYGSCKTLQLIDQERSSQITDADMISEIDEKMIELRKERQRFYDQRIAFNKSVRERARQEELNDIIVRAVNSGSLAHITYEPGERDFNACTHGTDLLVSLNDIHYGANVDNHWCKYNTEICKKMFEEYLDNIFSIADTHGAENCVVFANGDMISGNIHQQIAVTNKENLIEQVMGVSELIAGFLAELSKRFAEVRFVSVAGNHSRIDKKDRALQEERLDDLIEWYLHARLDQFRNIVIGYGHKIDCTMYIMDIRGKNYVGVHGDYDTSPSNIQSLQTMAGVPVYAVLLGHLHHNQTNDVSGIKTIMAGSFLGMDDFCVSRRIYGKPEQMVCVCDENGIKCSYDITFSK